MRGINYFVEENFEFVEPKSKVQPECSFLCSRDERSTRIYFYHRSFDYLKVIKKNGMISLESKWNTTDILTFFSDLRFDLVLVVSKIVIVYVARRDTNSFIAVLRETMGPHL